jgi:hypothetical protein
VFHYRCKAGRTRPAAEFLEELRVKHGFRVEITENTESDGKGILEWLFSQPAAEAGLRWFQGLEEAIVSLSNLPARCPLAPENKSFPFDVV